MSDAKAAKAREHALLFKISELEKEVHTLKNRLDELRKAKNTTQIKREREIVEVKAAPPATATAKDSDLAHQLQLTRAQLEEEKRRHRQELDELRLRKQADDAGAASRADCKLGSSSSSRQEEKVAAVAARCDHEPILRDLRLQVSDMESQNTALAIENSELHERIQALTNELSLREAKWCEREEDMKTTLQKKWEQMYAEWMRTTEGKIAELQATNELLKTMLSSNR